MMFFRLQKYIVCDFLFAAPFDPLRMCMGKRTFSVDMYYSSPILLAKSNREKLNFSHFSPWRL